MSAKTVTMFLAVACALAALYVGNQTVVPAMQRGPDVVTSTGWSTLVATILGAIGLGKLSQYMPMIQALLSHLTGLVPESVKPTAKQVADETVIALYSKLFSKATTPDEKTHLREAAKLVNDAEFERMFPADPATKAPV